MKATLKYLFLALMLALYSQAAARDIYSLNRGWTFAIGQTNSTSHGKIVHLPHTWNNDATAGKSDYYRGEGYYDRTLNIPSEWKGKRLFLRILGANSVTNLFINGKHVGEHRGGNSMFSFEVTDFVKFGDNNLLRIVVNNASRMDILPTAGAANRYGGLFRGVELIVTESYAISPLEFGSDGVWIKQESVTWERVKGSVRVALSGIQGEDSECRVAIRISDAYENLVTDNIIDLDDNSGNIVELPFQIESPTLWNGVDNPYMYNFDVRLTSGTRVVDSLSITTGFRELKVDPQEGLLLNGRPYPLRGAVIHRDRSMAGNALTPLQIEEDFNLLLEMGANAVRIDGGQHSEYFYDLCDRNGIIVWSEIPFIGQAFATDCQYINTEEFRNNGKQQLEETIQQLYNHPSIAFWGIFSKLNYRGDDPTEYVRQLNALTKQLDASRITAAISNQDGALNFITDVVVFEHSYGWHSGQPDDIELWSKQFQEKWGTQLCAGVSFAAGASIFHQDDKLERPTVEGQWHPEGWQTHFHERYMSHLKDNDNFFGIFVTNLFDYGAASRTEGDGRGTDDCGLITFDRKDKKDAFYLYKALWNSTEPFVHIVGRRYDTRSQHLQSIKVYSNQAEVDLVLNDSPISTKTSGDGIFIWEDLELQPGINRIEARSGWSSDKISLFIESDATNGATPKRMAPRKRTDL